ncbi:IS3 family transposase, partial [Bifidobacterium breve]|uniref:IS3 family transposase n=1 Tax=Bifidobacterium breve TaxID=1685 RepID=UPI003D055C0F
TGRHSSCRKPKKISDETRNTDLTKNTAEGFFGRMKTESVHPGRWEERARGEVLVPVDEYLRWHGHGRIKRSLGWMSPVQYRQSQGTAA